MLTFHEDFKSYCRNLGLVGSSGKIYKTTKKKNPSEENICLGITKLGFTSVEVFTVHNLL